MKLFHNDINTLVPTHNRLRNPHKKDMFKNLILTGTKFKNKIVIYACFSTNFVHDGHHRLCAWMEILAPYPEISIPEDQVSHQVVDLEWFTIANKQSGWLTPFNPFTEVRIPDFFKHKERLLSEFDDISSLGYLYKEPRRTQSIKELMENG